MQMIQSEASKITFYFFFCTCFSNIFQQIAFSDVFFERNASKKMILGADESVVADEQAIVPMETEMYELHQFCAQILENAREQRWNRFVFAHRMFLVDWYVLREYEFTTKELDANEREIGKRAD